MYIIVYFKNSSKYEVPIYNIHQISDSKNSRILELRQIPSLQIMFYIKKILFEICNLNSYSSPQFEKHWRIDDTWYFTYSKTYLTI